MHRNFGCSVGKTEKIHHKTLKVIYGIDNSYNNLLIRSSCLKLSKALQIFSDRDI